MNYHYYFTFIIHYFHFHNDYKFVFFFFLIMLQCRFLLFLLPFRIQHNGTLEYLKGALAFFSVIVFVVNLIPLPTPSPPPQSTLVKCNLIVFISIFLAMKIFTTLQFDLRAIVCVCVCVSSTDVGCVFARAILLIENCCLFHFDEDALNCLLLVLNTCQLSRSHPPQGFQYHRPSMHKYGLCCSFILPVSSCPHNQNPIEMSSRT